MKQPRTKHQKELIADLDWWSKFYASRDDLLKVRTRSIIAVFIVTIFGVKLNFAVFVPKKNRGNTPHPRSANNVELHLCNLTPHTL